MEKINKKHNKIKIKKYLPHNFLVEKSILSSLLTNSETIELILQHLTIEIFYFKNHQELYRAIIFLHQKKTQIDILTLTSFLQDNGYLLFITPDNLLTGNTGSSYKEIIKLNTLFININNIQKRYFPKIGQTMCYILVKKSQKINELWHIYNFIR